MKAKKILSFFGLLLAMGTASAVFTSCSGDAPEAENTILLVDRMVISATATEATYYIAVTSNRGWIVSSNAEWCTLISPSGTRDGKVTVVVGKNTTTSSRSATITVTTKTTAQTVTVTQAPANATLTLDQTAISAPSAAESYLIAVASNVPWTASSDAGWCTLSPPFGTNSGIIMVNVGGNTTTNSRSATITVTAEAITQTVTVTQAAANVTLTLDKTAISALSTVASYPIVVTSNSTWTVSSNAGWCTISPLSGTGSGIITVSVAENTTASSRSATVTVTGAVTKTVTIMQAAAPGAPLELEMVTVAGGNTILNSTSVTLSDFQIGKYEVTQKQWQDVMGSNPSHFKGDNLPVEMVSHDDVQRFLAALNSKTGKNYRLPTEAEWQYAAKGGQSTHNYEYSGSNTIDDVAWHVNNGGNTTHTVGTKDANELGIYDMTGNVWEWCSDWRGDIYPSSTNNPTGATEGSVRVYRGGSWFNRSTNYSVSVRYSGAPNTCNTDIGFRLVLPL
ncbi:hypothetical protein AGMMS4957_01730 [Bacteroidia bacterium]|nr:hypothetical protein AGMMS4957_01730 [Bacteroidia bacterium]